MNTTANIEQALARTQANARSYQAALAQLEAYALTDMPIYKDPEFLRAEILRIVSECREEIAAKTK